MLLIINGAEESLAKDTKSIGYIINKIRKSVEESELIFTHMMIDGIEVYEDFEEYIFQQIDTIKRIEVVLSTKRELVNGLLLSADAYLNNAIPGITKLSGEYYQGPSEETWSKFNQMMEGIQWIVQMIETIEQQSKEMVLATKLVDKSSLLLDVLQTLEEALTQSDNVTIGDMIQYEIKPLLDDIKENISMTIDIEVPRNDLN